MIERVGLMSSIDISKAKGFYPSIQVIHMDVVTTHDYAYWMGLLVCANASQELVCTDTKAGVCVFFDTLPGILYTKYFFKY